MKDLLIISILNSLGYIFAFIAAFLLYAAIRYKLFQKAGQAGWKSFVPFYGSYIEYKLAWNVKWFWINLIAGCAGMLVIIPFLGPIIAVASVIVMYFITVFFNLQLAKAFNQLMGFGIGLIFCGPVFRFLLAFDKSISYLGAQLDPTIFHTAKHDAKNMFVAEQNNESDEEIKIEKLD